MPQHPTSRELVNEAMGGGLNAYLRAQRRRQNRPSYPKLATAIKDQTGVEVDPRTVERWCASLGLVKSSEESTVPAE